MSKRSGLSVHALRFYEKEGLFANPIRRTPGGQRIYREEDLQWLASCARLRSSGMSLAAIRRYVELMRQGPGNEHERLALLHDHEKRVEAQIHELHECLDVIRYKVKAYAEYVARTQAGELRDPTPPDAEADCHRAAPAGPSTG
ncbi:MerR family transcriptional regulator [Nonomuraea antimicrobica]|uniref:MerR family transcriptional regulator n=1 Tax=Nonomuraea antimicrobica TaxID=561173 RepID=UPI0031EC66C9